MSYKNISVGVIAGAFINYLLRRTYMMITCVEEQQAVDSSHAPQLDLWVHNYELALKLGRFVIFYSLEKHGIGWFLYEQRTLHLPVKAHIVWLWEG